MFIYDIFSGINFLWVVIYEFGYFLGLVYFNVCGVIMYFYYIGYVLNMQFYFDDIVGIQYLYGEYKVILVFNIIL